MHQEPPRVSWWVWLSWLERSDGGGGFVYGCAAPSERPPGWRKDTEIEVAGAGRLKICQRTLGESDFDLFRQALDAGQINSELIFGRATPAVAVAATRTVIQPALGQTAVPSKLFYTFPELPKLVSNADGALVALLAALKQELSFPFDSSYAVRLGNFELFDLHPWLEAPQQFLIEVVRDNDKGDRFGPNVMEICRTQEFAAALHRAHFVGRARGDVILNRLIALPINETRVPVQIPELLDELDLTIFDNDGNTLHFENSHFMIQVGLNMSPLGRQTIVEDDLSGRAKQKGKELGARASTVVASSTHRSMIGAPGRGTWRHFAQQMTDIVSNQTSEPSDDKWFSRGVEGEVGAIAHLNRILNGSEVKAAVLVDPWFGAQALNRFALRISSQDIKLAIVTSWTTTDPDTRARLDSTKSPTEKLEAAITQVEPFMNPRLSVINLVDGNDQAFHDRYLLLYPHEGAPKAYLLSNSLNKAAGDWPFSMSLFSGPAAREAQKYIEGLTNGFDTARNKALTVTFRWPQNAAS